MSCGAALVFLLIVSVSGITAEFNIDVQDILEFYKNQGDVDLSHSVEDYVALIRDIIIDRISCSDLNNGRNCECLAYNNILKIAKGRYNDTTAAEVSNLRHQQSRKKEQLAHVSIIILNYFLRHENTCNNDTILQGYIGDCQIYGECRTKVLAQFLNAKNDTITDKDAVEKMLRQVRYGYEPLPNRKCVNAENILDGVEENEHNPLKLPKEVLISMRILRTILYGECIEVEDSASDFLDDIFLHYGENCNRILTMTGFAKLLDDLQMQRPSQHLDHEMNLSFCNKSYAWKHLSRTTPMPDPKEEQNGTSEHFDIRTKSGNVQTKGDKDLYESHQPLSDDEKTDVEIVSAKASTSINSQDKNLYLNEESGESSGGRFEVATNTQRTRSSRITRHTPTVREEPEHKNLANECLSPEELVQKFLTNKDVITSEDFLQMCPALVQQAVSGVCKFRAENPKPAQNLTSEKPTVASSPNKKTHSTLYAFGSITVITLLSLLGAILIPIQNKPYYVLVTGFFLGLAFTSMSGDALIHIQPQYLGLHEHHEGEDAFQIPKHTLKQIVLAVAIYVIYLCQTIFTGILKPDDDGHNHNKNEETRDNIRLQSVKSTSRDSMGSSNQSISDDIQKEKKKHENRKMFNSPVVFWEITSGALVLIVADTIHNFVDGAAISVAFANSDKDGFLTSVAVIFHEIPHEIADFFLLMEAGLPYKKALIINFVSGLVGYGGMLLGVLMTDAMRDWLLLLTAALFLYVAMGDMLPELKAPIKKKWGEYFVKQLGIITGLVLMVCISIFENSI